MIRVTRLNKIDEIIVNAQLIETIEATPDTVISLTTGRKILVIDTVDEVISKCIAYFQELYNKRF